LHNLQRPALDLFIGNTFWKYMTSGLNPLELKDFEDAK
jgi:hypothetical protein